MSRRRIRRGNPAQWISAQVNETYSDDPQEGIKGLTEGDQVILLIDKKGNKSWYKT